MLDAFDLLLHLSRELLLLAYRCLPDLSKMEIHVQLELLHSLLLALQPPYMASMTCPQCVTA